MKRQELLSDLLNERIQLSARIERLRVHVESEELKEEEMDIALDELTIKRLYLKSLTETIKYYEE